jgi:hypothetical protein
MALGEDMPDQGYFLCMLGKFQDALQANAHESFSSRETRPSDSSGCDGSAMDSAGNEAVVLPVNIVAIEND